MKNSRKNEFSELMPLILDIVFEMTLLAAAAKADNDEENYQYLLKKYELFISRIAKTPEERAEYPNLKDDSTFLRLLEDYQQKSAEEKETMTNEASEALMRHLLQLHEVVLS